MTYPKSLFAVCSLLASLYSAAAAPNTTPPKSCTPQQLATFDDIPLLNPTGPTQPVGVYRTLNFPGLTIGTFLSTSPTGVVPQSGTHDAVFNFETELLTLSPIAGITVKNDGSTTTSFTLSQFYYGAAVASQEGLVNVPSPATIVATGFNSAGKQVAQQSFPYAFTASKQGMMLAQPSSAFSNLYNVTFNIATSAISATQVGLLDSISLCTFTS